MSEIKCRVCGATPEQSESIYSEQDGGSQHRHLYQCVDFLQDSVISLRAELERVKAENEKYRDALHLIAQYEVGSFVANTASEALLPAAPEEGE